MELEEKGKLVFEFDCDPGFKIKSSNPEDLIDLSKVVNDYQGHPWYLTEKEARLMLNSYLSDEVLRKYKDKNIARFLNCWKEEWRKTWNEIQKERKQDHLLVQIL